MISLNFFEHVLHFKYFPARIRNGDHTIDFPYLLWFLTTYIHNPYWSPCTSLLMICIMQSWMAFFLAGSSKVVAVSHNLKIWSLYLSPSSGLNECLWQWVHSFGCHHWYLPRWYVGPNLESWLYDLGVHYGLVLHHCKTKTHMNIFLLEKILSNWKFIFPYPEFENGTQYYLES